MTAADLMEVQQGNSLGKINYRRPKDGELIESVGDFNEGVFPESSILTSERTKAYIATRRVPGVGVEEIVIALKKDGPGEPTIDIGAWESGSGETIELDTDPLLLTGALKLAMNVTGITVARLGMGADDLSKQVAETFKLQEDQSGTHIVKPPFQPIAPVPPSTW